MKHFASPAFWRAYEQLLEPIKQLADKNYVLLQKDAKHPSLHFKQIGRYRSVRVGAHYRALRVEVGSRTGSSGSNADYDRLIG